jgi:hypothetical protein
VADKISLLHPDGRAQAGNHLVTKGSWWPDHWITPALELEMPTVPAAVRVAVKGYNPDNSVHAWGNQLTLAVLAHKMSWTLPWGRPFELSLDLAPPLSGNCSLILNLRDCFVPDALDQRMRGVILNNITFHLA